MVDRILYSGGDKCERGVGLILDKDRGKCVVGYWQESDRVLLVKQGRPLNMAIIMVYAPTSQSTEEEIDKLYETLESAKPECKSQEIIIIMGDLNAIVGNEQDSEMIDKHGSRKIT